MPTYLYTPVYSLSTEKTVESMLLGRPAKVRVRELEIRAKSGAPPSALSIEIPKVKENYILLSTSHTGLLHGAAKNLRRLFGVGILKVTNPGDTVYIVAHGIKRVKDDAIGAEVIGGNRGEVKVTDKAGKMDYDGGVPKQYTPDALARHLKAEGLADRTTLKVFACGSGLQAQPGCDSFAASLKKGLVSIGYSNGLRVAGYLGEVVGEYRVLQGTANPDNWSDPNSKHKSSRRPGIDEETQAAKASHEDHRVWF